MFSTSAGANCDTGADPNCATAVTAVVPALTITKTADASQVTAGGLLRYTILATNTGQAAYPAATLTDALAGVLDDATYNGDAQATTGSIEHTDGTLTWTGALPVGAGVVITFSVRAGLAATGDAVLTNRVISTSVGSTCAEDTAAAGCATATVVAPRTITLTGLTDSFTLSGLPDSTVSSDGTVTMTVTTNSQSGYLVTVQARATSMTGGTAGNTVTIPISALGVRESGTDDFHPLSADTSLIVHQQDVASAPDGDAVSNDYRIHIPYVPSDTYSVALDYIVSAR